MKGTSWALHQGQITTAMHNPPQAPTLLTPLKSIFMQGKRLARQPGNQITR